MENEFEDLEGDVGLAAEDKKHVKSNQLDWFKGEKNRSYRMALVYFHPLEVSIATAMKKQNPQVSKDEIVDRIKKALAKRAEELSKTVEQLAPHERLDTSTVRFKKIDSHYKEGVGYAISRLGKDGPEADQIWKMMGDVKRHFTTTVLVYPTNREGELDKANLVNGWAVLPWRFSNKVYETLLKQASSLRENNLSIASQDLIVKCTNADYQNFDINSAGPSIWAKNAGFASKILDRAHALYDKLVPFREISTADLKIKLGLSSPGTDEAVGTDDFNDLLGQV